MMSWQVQASFAEECHVDANATMALRLCKESMLIFRFCCQLGIGARTPAAGVGPPQPPLPTVAAPSGHDILVISAVSRAPAVEPYLRGDCCCCVCVRRSWSHYSFTVWQHASMDDNWYL
mmetsp:Transcript_130439/g.254161  ORF Transcript_130439/g.254161 Transcript_130439/m.254161 type:complete len:119 (+) Transcript_130439:1091-1447(+)